MIIHINIRIFSIFLPLFMLWMVHFYCKICTIISTMFHERFFHMICHHLLGKHRLLMTLHSINPKLEHDFIIPLCLNVFCVLVLIICELVCNSAYSFRHSIYLRLEMGKPLKCNKSLTHMVTLYRVQR